MKIKVAHDVPYEKGYEGQCVYGNQGDFFGTPICGYLSFRNSYHGRKAPTEYHKPKCTLFDKWLDRPYTKCPECVAHCQAQSDAEDTNVPTIKEPRKICPATNVECTECVPGAHCAREETGTSFSK